MSRLRFLVVLAALFAVPVAFGPSSVAFANDSCGCGGECACEDECDCGAECDCGEYCECEPECACADEGCECDGCDSAE